MVTQPEARFKKRVLDRLRSLPCSWWEKIQQRGKRGTPDILGCVAGRFVALELKRSEAARIDPLQEYKLGQIGSVGGFAKVVFPGNWDQVWSELCKLLEDESSGCFSLGKSSPGEYEDKPKRKIG